RHKGAVLAAALVFGALLLGIAGTTYQAVRATRADGLAQAQRRLAKANELKAHQAVNDYYTAVSDNTPLTQPTPEPLRQQLLQAALRYYQEFVREHDDDPELQGELAATYMRIALITHDLGEQNDWLPAFQQAVAILETLLHRKTDPALLASLRKGIY